MTSNPQGISTQAQLAMAGGEMEGGSGEPALSEGAQEAGELPRAAGAWASVREMDSGVFHPNQICCGAGGMEKALRGIGVRSQMRPQGVQRKTPLVFSLHPIWGHRSPLVPQCPKLSMRAV